MKKFTLLLSAAFIFSPMMASADVLMKWARKPLPIDLQIEKERILFVDKNVKVGYPPELDSKLRIQSTGGAVYLKATADFPKTRLQLMDVATGEIILLDVQAKHSVMRLYVQLSLWKVCAKFHIAFLHRLKRSYLHCLCELLHYSAGNLMGMLSLRFACKTRGNLALI